LGQVIKNGRHLPILMEIQRSAGTPLIDVPVDEQRVSSTCDS
jgi:hypothetical protein